MRRLPDLTGTVIGRWTVLGLSDRRTPQGGAFWLCRCACGNEKAVAHSNLTHGNSDSCGCARKEHLRRLRKKRSAASAAMTHCVHGHPYGEGNNRVRVYGGIQKRSCVECERVRSREQYVEHAAFIRGLKEAGCVRCGETHPACLDIHHIDRSKKTMLINTRNRRVRGVLEKELENTEVLCANCHRKHHYEERQRDLSKAS